MALLHEVAYSEGVLQDVARCEPLVGLTVSQGLRVEEPTMSKNEKCFFCFMISLSSFHCASVGSTPVGF